MSGRTARRDERESELAAATTVQEVDAAIVRMREHGQGERHIRLDYDRNAQVVSDLLLDEALERGGEPQQMWKLIGENEEKRISPAQAKRIEAWVVEHIPQRPGSAGSSHERIDRGFALAICRRVGAQGPFAGDAAVVRQLLAYGQAEAEADDYDPSRLSSVLITVAAFRGLGATRYRDLARRMPRWEGGRVGHFLRNPDVPSDLARQLVGIFEEQRRDGTSLVLGEHATLRALATRSVKTEEDWSGYLFETPLPTAISLLLDGRRSVAVPALHWLARQQRGFASYEGHLRNAEWLRGRSITAADLQPLLESQDRQCRLAAIEALSRVRGHDSKEPSGRHLPAEQARSGESRSR